ncbi:hypothetical protein H0H81_006921 [Sphagnurus paluster]|uniref:Uncharacterized protein n=1 Tax=Sphagnurus paluster TaxID=117069 RepID=A0A9P7FUY8_9AGAR|nr:hypothetical protein H0H81_006921 [Sphagnurus paluster]
MPSFRTIFFVAATAFAALTTAAPVTDGPSAAVANSGGVLNPAIALSDVAVKNKVISGDDDNNKFRPAEGHHRGEKDDSAPGLHGRETQRSLCDAIVLATAKINVIWDQMAKASSKKDIDDNEIVGIIAQVKVVIDVTLNDAKTQRGRSMNDILTLNGRVVTKAELSNLLFELSTLVCRLLYIAAFVSARATVDVIVSVGVVFAEFLCVTFTLVDGLYVIIRPSLDAALKIAVDLKLDALVSVYNGVY